MERSRRITTLTLRIAAVIVVLAGLRFSMASTLAGQGTAQPQQTAAATQAVGTANCQPGQDLITIPEIARNSDGRLRAEIELTSGKRTLWGSVGDTRCLPQDLRYFTGRNLLTPNSKNDPAFAKGEPIPGPTLRARVGDLIEVRFLNHVDTQKFADSLDRAENDPANTTGCDEVRTDNTTLYPNGLVYPNSGKNGDVMPNCLHGSSTANLHFHGTHTTPSTTGDNILMFIRPALRTGKDRTVIRPGAALVNAQFDKVWATCEAKGSPTKWEQLPLAWRTNQEALLKEYDRTAAYKGRHGELPHDMRLWPADKAQIDAGVWPQYQIGAYPYCFRLANDQPVAGRPAQTMGQAPGTHWYHAHKHGSTALNVANGMTGAFVIEGKYDDDLRAFYGPGFKDQVLLIQQLSAQPFPVLAPKPGFQGPGSVPKPQLSVNGRLNPVVHMRPGEVQLWRIVNANYRSGVQFQTIAPATGLDWKQIAQDGVQLAWDNYNGAFGATDRKFNLAPANRADLLVRLSASATPGATYQITAQANEGTLLDTQDPNNGPPIPDKPAVLLTVKVDGTPVSPAQDFIQDKSKFPTLPAFLNDIPAGTVAQRRTLDFGAAHNLIDNKTFNQNRYSQIMELNDAEEWKVMNEAQDKSHPFHIHINPFQITEVFQPNAENTSDPTKPCYVDPLKPDTWKPCTPFTGPFVWWDTFAIPTAMNVKTTACTTIADCPAIIRDRASCNPENGQPVCRVLIPGYFKMRTRFVDYTGAYVLHCHILVHEDRGMMQLVEVVPDKPPYVHK